MGEERSFVCDVCKVRKGEANHWWICMIIAPNGVNKAPSFHSVCFTVFHNDFWKADGDKQEFAIACGEEHAQLLYSRWLATGTLEARAEKS